MRPPLTPSPFLRRHHGIHYQHNLRLVYTTRECHAYNIHYPSHLPGLGEGPALLKDILDTPLFDWHHIHVMPPPPVKFFRTLNEGRSQTTLQLYFQHSRIVFHFDCQFYYMSEGMLHKIYPFLPFLHPNSTFKYLLLLRLKMYSVCSVCIQWQLQF